MKHIPADLSVPVKSARSFRPLKDAWIDTTSPPRSRMLTVLGGLADFERDLIAARTGEGRKRAQERRQVRLAAEAHPTSTAGGSCSAMAVPFRGRTSPFRLPYREATAARSFFFNVVNFDHSNRFPPLKSA